MKNIDIHTLQNIENINFAGITLYEKNDTIYESALFGIPIRYIALAGGALWVLKKIYRA